MKIKLLKLSPVFRVCQIFILIALSGVQLACAHTASPPLSAPLQVTFIDVGQGDAIAVRCDTGSLLIDAGPDTATDSLLKTLENRGFARFDKLVITHPHEDHIGGVTRVVESFAIGEILMPDATSTTRTFSDMLTAIGHKGLTVSHPAPGSRFTVGTAACTILAPNAAVYDTLNNYSIVIHLVYGNTSFLFTGDAQVESEKEMLGRGYLLKTDVLKVSHHGSTDATSDAFLKAVAPRYAVISVGKDNDYGHPHAGTLAKLNTANVRIYRTDWNGTVTMYADGSNITVQTEK